MPKRIARPPGQGTASQVLPLSARLPPLRTCCIELVSLEKKRGEGATSGALSSCRRAASASTARRERRQARIADRFPIFRAGRVSGISIAYCMRAVLAAVDPFAAPRLSTTSTSRPAAASASAIIAPLMPAPITSPSVLMSTVSGPCVRPALVVLVSYRLWSLRRASGSCRGGASVTGARPQI
jgi:hypothetical protein